MKSSSFSRSRSRRSCWFQASVALLSMASLPLVASHASAATLTWDPGLTPATGSYGSGTWDATATSNWSNNTTDQTFGTGNTANFAGTNNGSTAAVTLGSAITAAGIVFNTAGYDVETSTFSLALGTGGITSNITSGTETIGGTLTSGGSQTWTVAAGGILQFNAGFSSTTAANAFQLTSNGTTNITGTFTVAGKSTLSGTTGGIINLSGTESFETSAGDYSGIAGVTVNNTAGSATFTGGTGNGFFLGNTGTAVGSTLNVTGGVVNIGNTRIFIGDGFSGIVTTAGDGTLTIGGSSGTASFNTGVGTLTAALGNNVATGTININANGTLASNRAWTAGTAAKGIINFNGGTLQALGTGLGITTGITTTIAEGGATIDSQTFAITLATNFTHGGTAATDGGLTLTSSAATGKGGITLTGTLGQTGGLTVSTGATISGNNTYTGATAINAFVDAKTSGNVFGATGAGNGTAINTGGTIRFRDTGNITIPEALTFNGGTFLTYNDPGTTTLSGAIVLNANTTLSVSPQAQVSTTLALSGGIADGATTGNNLALSRVGAAGTASADVINITGASTYGGTTSISDALNTNTGSFSVRLSGGDNRLPVSTVVTLGGATGGGVAAGSGRLILGDATNGAISQTIAGLTTSGTGTNNAVVGGATSNSTLIINNAAAYSFGGLLGGTATNANNLALTKNGAGSLTLTAANTYTGATTVSAGTLLVSGSINGSLSVSVGTTGALTLSNTAATVLADAGTLSLVSGATLNLNANGGTSEIIAALTLDGNSVAPGTYAVADLRTMDANINFNTLNGETLTIVAVPEPATYVGGLLLLGALGRRVRGRFTRRSV